MASNSNVFKSPYVGIKEESVGDLTFTVAYVQDGSYSVVLKISNSALQYCGNDGAYAEYHKIFTNLIKVLGEGYVLQKHDIYYRASYVPRKSKDYLSQSYQNHFAGRSFITMDTYLTITRRVSRGRLFSFNRKEYEAFFTDINKVVDLLTSRYMKPTFLNVSQTRNLIARFLSFDFAQESYSFKNFQIEDGHLNRGDDVIQYISLINIDEAELPPYLSPCKGDDFLPFAFPVDLLSFFTRVPDFDTICYHQVLSIPDQTDTQRSLLTKRKRHESMPDPANDLSVNDINGLLSYVAESGQMLVKCHYGVMVSCPSDKRAAAVNFINNSLFNAGIVTSNNAFNQFELFSSALPGNVTSLQDYDLFLTTSDAACCLLHKERMVTDDPSDFQVYFSDRQGVPVAVDTCDLPMSTGRINNRNMFILGPSGSGKSFFTNHLVRQYFLYDMDVILVDTGHSYMGLCNYYQGRYITYSEEKPITMNPFRIAEAEYNEEKREFIKSLIAMIWKGADGSLNQVEDSALALVVKAYFDSYFAGKRSFEDLCFNDFYDFSTGFLEDLIEERHIRFDLDEYKFILLRFYKGGQFERMLNDSMDTTLFDEKLIVFEIDAIKEHKVLFPIVTIIIMDVFLQKMRLKKGRKALIIEEAWKAIASPMMAGYLLYLYKTVRKFFGTAAVVTQEIDDIISNPIVKESILANSDTICLLDQAKFRDRYDKIAALLSLNQVEKNKIFTINQLDNKQGRGPFKEVYIKRGGSGEVYGVEVSLTEYLAFTTESREKSVVQDYAARHNSYREALEAMVAEMKASGLSMPKFIAREFERIVRRDADKAQVPEVSASTAVLSEPELVKVSV